jgi:hypothetical protein
MTPLQLSNYYPYIVRLIMEITSSSERREWALACDAHKPLILLLQSTDIIVLHEAIHALTVLGQSPRHGRVSLGVQRRSND